jgi:hypothetical protein
MYQYAAKKMPPLRTLVFLQSSANNHTTVIREPLKKRWIAISILSIDFERLFINRTAASA